MGTCCRSGDGRPCSQDECSNPRNVGAGCGAGEGLAWTLTVQLLAPKPAGLPFAEGFDAFCFFGFWLADFAARLLLAFCHDISPQGKVARANSGSLVSLNRPLLYKYKHTLPLLKGRLRIMLLKLCFLTAVYRCCSAGCGKTSSPLVRKIPVGACHNSGRTMGSHICR